MKSVCIVLGTVLALGASTVNAIPVTVQADYEPPVFAGATCGGGLPPAACVSPPDPGAQPILSLLFDIDRAVNGNYDVSAGVSGSFLDAFLASAADVGATLTLTATAAVQDGLVADLLLTLGFDAALDGLLFDYALNAAAGGYTTVLRQTFSELGPSAWLEYTFVGAYSLTQPAAEPVSPGPGPGPITPVPEPASWLLFAAALAVFPVVRRSRRTESAS